MKIVLPDLDRRATLAAQMSEARKLCRKAGVSFRGWVEDNTPYAYSTAVRLARIGDRPDPLGRLEDVRGRNARANRNFRARMRVLGLHQANLQGRARAAYTAMDKYQKSVFREWMQMREGKPGA